MSKFVRRETVRKCAIHQTIMERASEDLEHSGAFNKEEILETLGLIVMADSVRWDYIREFLQEDQGCELVPVAASYFKRHKRDEELICRSCYGTPHGSRHSRDRRAPTTQYRRLECGPALTRCGASLATLWR